MILRLALIAICMTVSTQASARSAGFGVYARASTAADPNVNENLFKTYDTELAAASAEIPFSAPEHERDSRISHKMKEANAKLVEALEAKTTSSAIAEKEGQEILLSLNDHPVVGMKHFQKYDPKLESGFCFGRAAYVHLELLRRGVAKDSIAKIFAIGRLRYPGYMWRFHVATIVRSQSGSWLVIDSLAGELMTVEKWMEKVATWDGNPAHPRVRFYLADAAKFQPNLGAYSPEALFRPQYNGYFVDLAKWFSAK